MLIGVSSYRKNSPYWWVSYTDANGKRTRRSTGTTDRREAEALEAKWKLEAYRARQWHEEPTRTFDEVMLTFLEDTGFRERDRFSAKRLYGYFSEMEIHSISPATVKGYLALRIEAGAAAATINKEIGLIRTAIDHVNRELGWDLPNPFRGRKLKEAEGRLRWITKQEAITLIEEAEHQEKAPHMADFIRLALSTGMRRGEMLNLEWQRVNIQQRMIYLNASDQKNRRSGSIPMNTGARNAILSRARFRAEHRPGTPWVFCSKTGNRIQSIKRSFATACRRAGIEDFRIHDLRHTAAAWMVQSGISIREVAEVLRHSDIQVTMRYAHLAPENVRATVAVLNLGHNSDTPEINELRKSVVSN
jgi:integrase